MVVAHGFTEEMVRKRRRPRGDCSPSNDEDSETEESTAQKRAAG